MEDINEKGLYYLCTEIQKTGGVCKISSCYYNKYTGSCNFQEKITLMRTPTLEVSQRIEDLLLST